MKHGEFVSSAEEAAVKLEIERHLLTWAHSVILITAGSFRAGNGVELVLEAVEQQAFQIENFYIWEENGEL